MGGNKMDKRNSLNLLMYRSIQEQCCILPPYPARRNRLKNNDFLGKTYTLKYIFLIFSIKITNFLEKKKENNQIQGNILLRNAPYLKPPDG
jgi:hypothetical protein